MAAQASWNARQGLLSAQMHSLGAVRPDLVLDTFPERLSAILIQTFYTQPAVADIGNYLEQTRTAELIYFSNLLNQLFRGLVGGSVLMILTLFGFILGIWQIIKSRNIDLVLLWGSGLVVFFALALFVSLPVQRYYIPFVPFTCLWGAYGIGAIIREK